MGPTLSRQPNPLSSFDHVSGACSQQKSPAVKYIVFITKTRVSQVPSPDPPSLKKGENTTWNPGDDWWANCLVMKAITKSGRPLFGIQSQKPGTSVARESHHNHRTPSPLPRLPTHIPTFWMKRSIFVMGELFSVRGGAEGFGCGRGVVRQAAGVYRAL